jgi:carboxylesterase type B
MAGLLQPDPETRINSMSIDELASADMMHAAWVSFATRGDPGWSKCDLARRATMRFDAKSQVVDDPRSVERIAFLPAAISCAPVRRS